MLEGDEAGAVIHAGAGQPVCCFTCESRFANATKARDDYQLTLQQCTLNLQQFTGSPAETIAWLNWHLLVQTRYRRCWCLLFSSMVGFSWNQEHRTLLVEVWDPPIV